MLEGGKLWLGYFYINLNYGTRSHVSFYEWMLNNLSNVQSFLWVEHEYFVNEVFGIRTQLNWIVIAQTFDPLDSPVVSIVVTSLQKWM
jgi:hypothetical protein